MKPLKEEVEFRLGVVARADAAEARVKELVTALEKIKWRATRLDACVAPDVFNIAEDALAQAEKESK